MKSIKYLLAELNEEDDSELDNIHLKNPETGRENKLTYILSNPDHPLYDKAKAMKDNMSDDDTSDIEVEDDSPNESEYEDNVQEIKDLDQSDIAFEISDADDVAQDAKKIIDDGGDVNDLTKSIRNEYSEEEIPDEDIKTLYDYMSSPKFD